MDLREMVELLEDCKNTLPKSQTLMKEASKSCSDLDLEVGSNMAEDDQCVVPGQLIYKLRQQLIEKDNAIKQLGSEYDHNLSKVLSSLLYLEGKLHREQKNIVRLMEQKDSVISRQDLQIKQLYKRIYILQSSITDIQSKMDSNGMTQSMHEKYSVNSSDLASSTKSDITSKRSEKYSSNSDMTSSQSNINSNMNSSVTNISGNEGNSIFKQFSKPLRDKFTRHKSSVDLRSFKLLNDSDGEYNHRSMENIPQVVRRERKTRDKERCMSIAGYPNFEKFENDPELTAFMNSFHATNQTLAEVSGNSVENLAHSQLEKQGETRDGAPEKAGKPTHIQLLKAKDDLSPTKISPAMTEQPNGTSIHTSHRHTETNPLKFLRDTFKRKGSRQVKNKKQSFNLKQNTTKDSLVTLKFNEKHGNS
ncbi:uncharacterized protein LOC115214979 isoform X2 [Octopus sinensis]|uniref:Uncharacterized protein LOC115214979 isoform X2 n=1 Tax=Octopus sinensis TaxID=2607531 RepID=A0A7E6EUQ2_9MOLL|nr:uncharacterized protein LOC115214979 isoform X2 [Octopus sinensis]XP_036359376.1 uncharacterized protein LOC115214979 isoform X2 [Octopus sinensis]XP_036359381.1 uncharacterized protein LOC115214979 isoform X2 [Octopus sinensis]XP_036359383.1 uncharacterized protein LOC115214979 isoform X2 [Octopus sinensis]